MDLVSLLVALLVFCIFGYLAYWVITKFFPEPMRVVALAVTGVILLIILLSYSGVGGYMPSGGHGINLYSIFLYYPGYGT